MAGQGPGGFGMAAARAVLRLAGRLLRGLGLLVAALLLAVAAFLVVAWGHALNPEAGRRQVGAAEEPAVHVCATLAHADVFLPLDDPLTDWRSSFPGLLAGDLPQGLSLGFGWGDLVFFQETPGWSDLRVQTAAGALAGWHETALRVIVARPPDAHPDCRRLALDRAGRAALIAHVRGSLLADAGGNPQPRPGGNRVTGYYLARGRYGPMNTCNQWVADGLRSAGLPQARFAPFSFGVTWPLDALPPP